MEHGVQPVMEREAPLVPDLAICDPHHHLWEYPDSVYLPPDLRADGAALNITSTVFVECGSAYRTSGPERMAPVGETTWVAEVATGDGTARGIVGFADLTAGAAVDEVLAAHLDAGGGRFRGIRHASAWDESPAIRESHTKPPPGLLLQPDFRAGLAAVGRAGLSFDAWLYHPQLPELLDLARALPEVSMVLDHLGGPLGIGPYAGREAEVRVAWQASMRQLASCPNVTVKLGGIGMPIYGRGWHRRPEPPTSEEVARAWGPDVRWLIETFGSDRCMFESNFPVDRRSFGYHTCWNAFIRMVEGCSDHERRQLFHDNAVRVYRL